MPIKVVPESSARRKGNLTNSRYIQWKYKNHTNVSMFSKHYVNVFIEMVYSMHSASTVNYVGQVKNQRHH